MKAILEWSVYLVGGLVTTAIYHAYGVGATIVCMFCLAYMTAAHWYVGRYLE